MNALLAIIATLAAGALGAVVRATVVARARSVGTTVVNIVGTLLLALVIVANDAGTLDASSALVLGVGLSGSLTTFSGWMTVLADGLADRPPRTVLLDLLLPLLVAVGLTVLVFAVLG